MLKSHADTYGSEDAVCVALLTSRTLLTSENMQRKQNQSGTSFIKSTRKDCGFI